MNFRFPFLLMITISLIGAVLTFGNDVRPRNQYGNEIFCPHQGFNQKCNAICKRKKYLLGFCDQKTCLCKVRP
uniref:Putative sodium channel toxin Ts18 n=2 Tax=Tityus TaxID=6886 RepID=SCX18_TITSE|nr:RecName: Full=Putative sodium channel toxin Ts18; AltName: Full=Putative alpha-NaTx; AltName: Full=Putative alpha-toxin; AltName: Full=Tityustoxin-18; Flags: Precursor [Tityus serrulatus]QPD99022.1 putative sodium channel toxin Ts18 [Tityus serrulatus]WLF82743.1 putative NaTx [Tityus melici]